MLKIMMFRLGLALCIAASICFVDSPAAQAATITVTATYDGVTPGGCTPAECTLRDAVILANSTPEPDVIYLPAGVFMISAGGQDGDNEDLSQTGDLDINRPVTIIGQGVSATKLYSPYDRIVDILPNSLAVGFQGIQFEQSQGGNSVINGGALRCTGQSVFLTISNSRFFLNSSGSQGGNGGAMYLDNCVTIIQNTTFERNYTIGTGSSGGAIYARLASLHLIEVRITGNNSKGSGGGVFLDGCATNIEKSTIHANNTDGMGGGVHIESGSATIDSSLIAGNFAFVAGGGVFNAGNGTIITNSTIGENSTSGSGGGVANAGLMTIRYSTITKNLASKNSDTGNGGGVATVRAGVTLNVVSTIIGGNNHEPDGPNDCSQAAGSVVSQGHNLVKAPGGCSSFSAVNGDILGVDPLLGNLVNNGGYTLTYALLMGSPAVNHGTLVSGFEPLYDQRGVGYQRVLIGRVDIGAYEADGISTYLPLVFGQP